MVTRKQFEKALRVVKEYQEQSKSEIDTLKKELEVIENTKIVNIDVDKSICDIDISVRLFNVCLLYTSPSPRDRTRSRMPSSA